MNKKIKLLVVDVIIITILIIVIVGVKKDKILKGYQIFGKKTCTCSIGFLQATGGLIFEDECTICGDKVTSYGEPNELCKKCAKLTDRCQNCGKINK